MNEFLYDMSAWQLKLTIRGHYRGNRDLWSVIRWQTYNLMSVGMADIKKAGIYKPTDLIKFPWDDEGQHTDMPTAEEIAELQREIAEYNAGDA